MGGQLRHTGMCHVQQRTGCVALNAHVLRLGQSGQRPQGSRPCDLCFILFMGRQVGDAPNRIALHFDVWGHHLADQRGQSSKQHDGNLILGYGPVSIDTLPSRSVPVGRTVDGKISEGGTGGPLHLDVRVLQKE